ncbi:unnamed protein product [Orchesella dallaii]|uniref:Uncharacterized protein n=1 Tax=Orchesella dallaii TaxID=48710 RepID=A0ABP1RSF8_9HEXA
MGRLRHVGLWSLAAVAVIAWIPYASCGSSSKNAIKLVKPQQLKPSQEKFIAATRRQQMVSSEDEDGYPGPGRRPSFGPFSQGFPQGPPPQYRFGSAPDAPQDRFDMDDASSDTPSEGSVGFMPEFGPPKGFPDLSKITGGEFGKMDAPAGAGSYENSQYNVAPQASKYRPFPQFAPQGGPNYYDESDDGQNEGPGSFLGGGGLGGPQVSSQGAPQLNAPRRRPYRSGRPNFGGSSGRPGGFGGPGGPGSYGAPEGIGGPGGPYGAPDGLGGSGPGPYGGGPGLDGPSRPFGSSGRPSRPGQLFGASSDGPSGRPGLFGGSSDGPSGRPGPFGGSSDGPSGRPGLFGGSSDGPSGRPGLFGGGSDGPSGRPGLFGGGSSDGPSRPLFGASSDGPSRPSPFDGLEGPSSGGPYGGPSDGPSRPGSFSGLDGPSSRPGSFDGPPSRPGGFSNLDGPSRPGPFGRTSRPGPYGAPGGRPDGPGSYNGPETGAFSVQNSSPLPGAFRLSRGYPRFHPNQIQNDDFKESADNGDFTPFEGPQYNYGRQQPDFRPDEEEQGPESFPSGGPGAFPRGGAEGPGDARPSRPEFSQPQQQPFLSSTHRQDNSANKRPIILKDDPEESPRGKPSYRVKSRPKRDVDDEAHGHLSSTSSSRRVAPCESKVAGGCVPSTPAKRLTRKSAPLRGTAIKTASNKTDSQDPMLADGTQQTGYWETAPYGTYTAAYKKRKQSTATVQAAKRQDEFEEDEPVPAVAATSRRKNETYHDTTSDEQRFFPSFPAPAPYLNPFSSGGNFGRPPLFPGPTANRAPSRFHPQFGPKYTSPPPNRGPSSAYPAESHDRYLHTNLLGSGNFEVVRGGTYYGDDDEGYHSTGGGGGGGGGAGHYHQEDDDSYFHHNGHSSPHGYRNNPSAGGGDFFANFRDFADINPPSRSFSHHHETVADIEPDGSASHEQPKNILDKLESSSDKIEVHQEYTSRDKDPMMATF